jgi:hypothetical protein
MDSSSSPQLILPLGTPREEAAKPAEVDAVPGVAPPAPGAEENLHAAIADPNRESGFLPLAEQAVRARPDDGHILLLAVTAALLDGNCARAQTFLKRFSKRFVPAKAYHLLRALALAQDGKSTMACSVLEAHGLTRPFHAFLNFPAGMSRQVWLYERLERIFERRKAPLRQQAASRAGTGKGVVRSRTGIKATAPQHRDAPPQAGKMAATPAMANGLPLLEVDIPFSAEIELAPLLGAMASPPAGDGGWYRLRERHTRLGLAQGFDELLCLQHVRGIETFWYQVETVRKVLKQFRGRVLLADEVGLGKTVEAGMVLKEYLLRGMVENVLVLTPASLVGQWREELETKFDITCATTHDGRLRSDPDGFWAEKRLIASLPVARRAEHAARLLDRSFDLVIVDEAHHLRDRTSQSYKLVDALNKRFLLLLSATPVQNDLTELYNVLTLLKPGIFKTLKEFRAAHMTAGKPRQPANPE